MRHRYQLVRLTRLSRRLRTTVLGCGISLALLASLGAGALAAGTPNVVPASGKVAGHGYGYWLKRSWQATFSTTSPAKSCRTLTSDGHRVGYLTLRTLATGTAHYTCSEPAGRPMYVVGLSNECSTFKGDHDKFGTSDQQLKRCAKALFKGARDTTSIDGHPVNVGRLVTASSAFAVEVPRRSPYGFTAGAGRSAAYGFGLLLTGFAPGTHQIHTRWAIGAAKWNITFTVHVR